METDERRDSFDIKMGLATKRLKKHKREKLKGDVEGAKNFRGYGMRVCFVLFPLSLLQIEEKVCLLFGS
jgi:hypothetical protein